MEQFNDETTPLNPQEEPPIPQQPMYQAPYAQPEQAPAAPEYQAPYAQPEQASAAPEYQTPPVPPRNSRFTGSRCISSPIPLPPRRRKRTC